MQNQQVPKPPLFMLSDHGPIPVPEFIAPVATLHDCGELVVVNPNEGRTRHQCAMVLVFESEEEARAVLRAGACQFTPSKDLDPNVLEEIKRG